jgi:ribosomal protein S18 acetylase RimI-like enzyme
VAKLSIRDATPEDLASIEAIFRSYRSNYDWKYAKRYYKAYFGLPDLHAKEAVLVGVVEDRVVGVIGYIPNKSETDDIFWLGWFYVHKDAKGGGHGKRLLERVVRDVKKRGGRKLYTDTSSWRFYDRAHHRYKDYGFKAEARLKDYYGKGEDQVIYGMNLK